jgi:hypothetical protein
MTSDDLEDTADGKDTYSSNSHSRSGQLVEPQQLEELFSLGPARAERMHYSVSFQPTL